jgi:hypothetical protein
MARRPLLLHAMVPVGRAAALHVRATPPQRYPVMLGTSPAGIETVAYTPEQVEPLKDYLLTAWRRVEAERQIVAGLADRGAGTFMEEESWAESLLNRFEVSEQRIMTLKMLGGNARQIRAIEHRAICNSPEDRAKRNAWSRYTAYRRALDVETPDGYRLRNYDLDMTDTGVIRLKWQKKQTSYDVTFYTKWGTVSRTATGRVTLSKYIKECCPEEVMAASMEVFGALDALGVSLLRSKRTKKR